MRPRGFSLIEVVISIFLIGLLVVLSGVFLMAAPLSRHVKLENTALSIAGNKLEELRGAGYAALPVTGPFSSSALSALPQGAGDVTVTDYNTRTKQVVVTVAWREKEASATSTVALTTLITEIGGLP
jgi:prepilin-type N-terminal cleavage/methylation domain-containing protein